MLFFGSYRLPQWTVEDKRRKSTPLCDNGGSFWKVGITVHLFA